MRRHSITIRLLFLVICSFIITTVSILFVADRQLTKIIDQSQDALYSEKLDAILANLSSSNERLKKTGLVDAYIEDFKESALTSFKKTYYQKSEQQIFPFIIDFEGRIVVHPVLPDRDFSLEQTEIVDTILASDGGFFESDQLGRKTWFLFKQFPDWDWIVCYEVPLAIKYRDALKFRYLLAGIMGGITFAVLLVLAMMIAQFTKPIRRLTSAAAAMAEGNLDQQINSGGRDEVGILARSFSQMRDSVQKTISALEKENNERKKAENELAQEKENLAVTLRSIGDGVITTDTSGKIVLLNKVAEELTGWSNVEAVGKDLPEVFPLINGKTGKSCDSPVAKVVESGEIVFMENHTVLICRDGRERTISDSGAPIRDVKSEIIGVVLVFRDITEQIIAEKELLKTKQLESIGMLAGGIAHDFNNILVAILGNINLALMDSQLEQKTKKLLTEAEKASVRAGKLTKQLLTFARGGTPIKEVCSLEPVIKDSAHFVLHGDKTACHFDFPENLWLVDIDKAQIGQVVQNIVLNASQAMPKGGTVYISCDNIDPNQTQDVLLEHDKKYVSVMVRDNGVGIPAHVVGSIFDPYYTTKQKGSGLGLPICHSIITKHNGRIEVSSVPGEGTTVTIHLIASPSVDDHDGTVETTGKGMVKGKIMVMDDEDLVRDVAEAMLNQMGHTVVLTADGEEAVRRYKESYHSGEPIDAVIMDLTIPGGMGGQEAVKQILEFDPAARVIVSSGYSNDPIMAYCHEYGFCASIVKPYKMADLVRVVNQVAGQTE